ncbi:hypothetical protein WMZ97_01590 [Lentibacillus sp. N15]|uniref:hypothetical protein n=1 Tax=Lentibacillus songyuanensis TaxID=3136161 RepID=UPI0031BADE2A
MSLIKSLIRVGCFTPYYRENRGNAITTKRISKVLDLKIELWQMASWDWKHETKSQQTVKKCDCIHETRGYCSSARIASYGADPDPINSDTAKQRTTIL